MSANTTSVGKDGFTLIELMVVISIITVLAGLIISAINNINGDKVKCLNNLRNIGIAILQYENDYGRFPWSDDPEPAATFQLLVDAGLIDEPELFICPACLQTAVDYNDGDFHLEPENVSYTVPAKPVSSAAPSRTILVADAHWYEEDNEGHKDGIIVFRKSGAAEEIKLKAGDSWEEATHGKLKR